MLSRASVFLLSANITGCDDIPVAKIYQMALSSAELTSMNQSCDAIHADEQLDVLFFE